VIPLLDAQLKAVNGDWQSEQDVSNRIVALVKSHDRASDEALVVLLCFYVGESQEEADGVIARGKKMYPLLKKYRYRTPELPGRSYRQLLQPENIKRDNFEGAVTAIRKGLRGTWDNPEG
jgi:hypothetical protein